MCNDDTIRFSNAHLLPRLCMQLPVVFRTLHRSKKDTTRHEVSKAGNLIEIVIRLRQEACVLHLLSVTHFEALC